MQLYAASVPGVAPLLDVVEYPYRLYSYQFMQPSLAEKIVDLPATQTMMDSGLFSFMSGARTIEPTLEAFHEYTTKYLADLGAWGYLGWVIEADAQKIIGVEQTQELRELFEPIRHRTMYVWHAVDGVEGLERMALEYDYISYSFPELLHLLGSRKAASMSNDLLRRIHGVCKRKGKLPPKVHILGCSTPRVIQTWCATSCDSAAWTSGRRFGTTLVWNVVRGFQNVSINSEWYKRYRAELLKARPEIEEQVSRDYDIDHVVGAWSFKLYQHWLNTRYTCGETR